jgi:Methionine biosynthesis protein MetW
VSVPSLPTDDAPPADEPPEGRAEAVAALRAAFTRLQPQGSDAWNFLAAFTHLGDRYGPYQPGASDISTLLDGAPPAPGGRLPRRRRRSASAPVAGPIQTGAADSQTELAQAMAQVVEAFRFLSARVRTLEARLAYQDHPVDGAAWLVPAQELGPWVEPVAAHLVGARAPGEVVHADCGEGQLLRALTEAGLTARGVEPRGAVALDALERGCSIALVEVADDLAACPAASLGGLALSGVVDRLPLHALVALLDQARRVLALGAPLVVVASDPDQTKKRWDGVARDILRPRPLHAETWELLLQRAGFVAIAPLDGGDGADTRFGLSATTPR